MGHRCAGERPWSPRASSDALKMPLFRSTCQTPARAACWAFSSHCSLPRNCAVRALTRDFELVPRGLQGQQSPPVLGRQRRDHQCRERENAEKTLHEQLHPLGRGYAGELPQACPGIARGHQRQNEGRRHRPGKLEADGRPQERRHDDIGDEDRAGEGEMDRSQEDDAGGASFRPAAGRFLADPRECSTITRRSGAKISALVTPPTTRAASSWRRTGRRIGRAWRFRQSR